MSTRPFASLLCVSLLTIGLAGCLDAEPPPSSVSGTPAPTPSAAAPVAMTVMVEDPAGDAYEPRDPTGLQCEFTGPLTDVCTTARATVSPAPPGLDILAVSFGHDADDFWVEVQLAGLPEDLWDLHDPDHEGIWEFITYSICWAAPEVACANVIVEMRDGVGHAYGQFWSADPRCNGGAWCRHLADPVIVPGTPGTWRLPIPRWIVPGLDGSTDLAFRGALVHRWTTPKAGHLPHAHVDEAPPALERIGAPSIDLAAFTDRAFAAATYLMDTPMRLPSSGTPSGVLVDGSDGPYVGGMDLIDLQQVLFLEHPDRFTVAVQLAETSLDPATYRGINVEFGIADGPYIWAGLESLDGDHWLLSTMCVDGACELPISAYAVVAPGRNGWVNFTFSRDDMPPIEAGSIVTMFDTYTWSERHDLRQRVLGVEVHREADWPSDGIDDALRYWTRYASSPTDRGVRIADMRGDAVLPTVFAEPDRAEQYDLLGLQIEPVDDGMVHVALSVADLSSMTPPTGYDAIVYGVGVRTDDGDFMLGYYRGEADPAGRFFCAPDTLFFGSGPGDPAAATMTPTEGSVTVGGGRTRAPAGAAGSATTPTNPDRLVVLAPPSCFGAAGASTVVATDIAAGTFAVLNPSHQVGQGTVHVFDAIPAVALSDDESILAQSARAADEDLSAWQRITSADSFWDVTGLIAALAISLIGLILVRRKRAVMTRYVARVEAACAIHDVAAREAALLSVQNDLRDDLLRGRIAEGQYAIVERRLEDRLAAARLELFAATFGDLPHWLVAKLQRLLSDGALSEDDYRTMSALIEGSDIPAATKSLARQRLSGWVVVDGRDAPSGVRA